MSDATNRAKTIWNKSHYRQLKISVDPSIAAAFQTACVSAGVSMASQIIAFMAAYNAITPKEKANRSLVKDPVSTKQKRRELLNVIRHQMELIRDAQEQAKDNIPVNLQGTDAYETAEESLIVMDEIIDLLDTIY